jgi:hypothetical protein
MGWHTWVHAGARDYSTLFNSVGWQGMTSMVQSDSATDSQPSLYPPGWADVAAAVEGVGHEELGQGPTTCTYFHVSRYHCDQRHCIDPWLWWQLASQCKWCGVSCWLCKHVAKLCLLMGYCLYDMSSDLTCMHGVPHHPVL